MVVSQAYAEFNHQIIDRLVLDAICKGSGKKAHIVEQIYTTHNYIDFSMKMMRKGAVAAPEGRKLVIPFNMRDGVIIARGKGNEDWNQSAPHGAGRLLSRSDAKELIDLDEFREAMKGIYSTSICKETIDESPMAYKPMDEIIANIEPTAQIVSQIKPIYNFKAGDEE
jgi:RNA-splicing ligase RtcB